MSKIKMSLYFKLPATGLIRSLSSNACVDSNCDGVSEYEAAELAISSYDANQDLITKQAEYIKMLRDALHSMVKMVDEDLLSDCDSMHAEMVFGSAEKALEATKPVEE